MPKLTPEEKALSNAKREQRLSLQLAKLRSDNKKSERRTRAKELIEIGAAFCQFHDRKKLLEYLKKPTYKVMVDGKVTFTETKGSYEDTSINLNTRSFK